MKGKQFSAAIAAKDAVSETRVRGYLPPGRAGVNVRMTEGRQN
jgi:hypothetical protein